MPHLDDLRGCDTSPPQRPETQVATSLASTIAINVGRGKVTYIAMVTVESHRPNGPVMPTPIADILKEF